MRATATGVPTAARRGPDDGTMELKTYPDRILRARCHPFAEVTDEDFSRAREMLEFMYQADGVGLAGSQVGWSRRIVTLDVGHEGKGERIFINPVILHAEGEVEEEEGCLSLPGVRADVRRSARVTVAAYTILGKRVEQQVEGLLARAWEHELDHLNGILFIDRLEPTALMTLRHKLREFEAAGHRDQKV